jgi:hypothetical protein
MSTARLGGTRGSVNKLLMLVGLVVLTASVPLYALAQMQSEETILVGRVQGVDESGTERSSIQEPSKRASLWSRCTKSKMTAVRF